MLRRAVKNSQQTLSLAEYDTRVSSGSRGRSSAHESPLQVSNIGVRNGRSWGCLMSDEGSAALAGNTSHLGQDLRQYNRRRSRPHAELLGKALHQWYTREDTQ